jgi:hypothetical protein
VTAGGEFGGQGFTDTGGGSGDDGAGIGAGLGQAHGETG